MNISNKKTKNKIVIVVIASLVFIAGVVGGFLWWQNSAEQPFEDDTTEVVDSDETDTTNPNNETSPATVDNEKTIYSPADADLPVTQPTITFARESGGRISVGSFFTQSASGDCKLVLSKPGEIDVVKITTVVIEAQYICQFWDITVPSSGGWTAKLTNVNGSSESSADTRAVEVL